MTKSVLSRKDFLCLPKLPKRFNQVDIFKSARAYRDERNKWWEIHLKDCIAVQESLHYCLFLTLLDCALVGFGLLLSIRRLLIKVTTIAGSLMNECFRRMRVFIYLWTSRPRGWVPFRGLELEDQNMAATIEILWFKSRRRKQTGAFVDV